MITNKSQNNKGELNSSLIPLSMHLGQLNAHIGASNENLFPIIFYHGCILNLLILATQTFFTPPNIHDCLLPQAFAHGTLCWNIHQYWPRTCLVCQNDPWYSECYRCGVWHTGSYQSLRRAPGTCCHGEFRARGWRAVEEGTLVIAKQPEEASEETEK